MGCHYYKGEWEAKAIGKFVGVIEIFEASVRGSLASTSTIRLVFSSFFRVKIRETASRSHGINGHRQVFCRMFSFGPI